MRHDDIFATYAIVPPPAARNKDYYQTQGLQQPSLRVTAEDDRGVTLNGMKMLASSAAYAHEVLIGNVMPLAPDQLKEFDYLCHPAQPTWFIAVVAAPVQSRRYDRIR